MNVCLQSVFACPALLNLLHAIAENPDIGDSLQQDGLLKKMVHTSKFLDDKLQLDPENLFA